MKVTAPLASRWDKRTGEGRRARTWHATVGGPILVDAPPKAAYDAWRRTRPTGYFVLKRALDIMVALLALLLCAPLLLVISALIWLDDRGPVIFTREVIGQGGRRFKMYKFRTMCERAEDLLLQDEALLAEYQRQHFKLRGDPRVTRLGRTLRKYSLDETPQLFNVLVGQMSLVGPRCVPPVEVELFGEVAELRAWVKPGLSGLWQVSGRSNTTYDERICLDRDYVERCSLWLDIGILLRTLPAVARGDGAY